MGDMGDYWRDFKEWDDARKQRNLKYHESVFRTCVLVWVVHTEYHWSTSLNDKRLDFWPSRNKWQYEGKIYTGDVYGFIQNRRKDSGNED